MNIDQDPAADSGLNPGQTVQLFALLEFTNITGHQQVVSQDLFASAVPRDLM